MNNTTLAKQEFRNALKQTINYHNQEAVSNTPDFILADFLAGQIDVFNKSVNERELFYGRLPCSEAVCPSENKDAPPNLPSVIDRLKESILRIHVIAQEGPRLSIPPDSKDDDLFIISAIKDTLRLLEIPRRDDADQMSCGTTPSPGITHEPKYQI